MTERFPVPPGVPGPRAVAATGRLAVDNVLWLPSD